MGQDQITGRPQQYAWSCLMSVGRCMHTCFRSTVYRQYKSSGNVVLERNDISVKPVL